MKILHVVSGLDVGGAETMLFRLVQSSKKHEHIVVSLTVVGKLGKKLSMQGVEVHAMGLRTFLLFPVVLVRLVKLMRVVHPDVVQTWMYHSDLLGGLAARFSGVKRLYWGIRNTRVPNARISITRLAIWLGAKLSWYWPANIICCADSARVAHQALGYCPEKMLVIENGYDVEIFSSAGSARKNYRELLGYKDTDIVIGIVGRFDPLKDYRNFVEATAKVAVSNISARFLMVGRNISLENNELRAWIEQSGCAQRYRLLGEREDIPSLLSVLDIFCLSSKAEGFPNVVAEAMASGVPCVVTDVGDSARIVRDTGVVVPPENSDALAQGIFQLIGQDCQVRRNLGERAKRVVQENFSIQAITGRYEQLYEQ